MILIVCQLRLDFDSFTLNDPISSTTSTGKAVNKVIIADGVGASQAVTLRGTCGTDSFQAFGDTTLSTNPPTICGINTGQHMYVDASDQCNILQMGFGSGTSATVTSAVTIKVTQVKCSSKLRAPDGCLQYFTEDTGTIQSFNNGGTGLHLAAQDYRLCVRPNRGMCSICYSAATTDFGLGVYSKGTDANSFADTYCGTLNEEGSADFITIPGGVCPPGVAALAAALGSNDRYCGTHLMCTKNDFTSNAVSTVCSMQRPFRIDVFTDLWEDTAIAASAEGGATNGPTQVGFALDYWQQTTCITKP